MAEPTLPNFLILGAAKCGTTSLYAYLDQHPDVFFSTPKEPIFFEAEYERGLDYYRQRYFGAWQGERAVGEARTHNLMLPYVAPRVRESLPDARLIALIRNPVERAFSHWWHRYSRGLETRPFFDAVRANQSRIEAGLDYAGAAGEERWRSNLIRNRKNVASREAPYLELGHYAEQIDRYLGLFPRARFEVVLFEDLAADAEAVAQRLWGFLGVDPDRPLENPAPRNEARHRIRGPARRLAGQLPKPAFLKRWVPESLQARAMDYVAGRPVDPPTIEPEAEDWLLEHFEPHNRALERLLGVDLPGWLRAERLSPGRVAR